MKKILIKIYGIVLIVLTHYSVYGQNYINNGGFESGDLKAAQDAYDGNDDNTTAEYLDNWIRAKGTKGEVYHSPDWNYGLYPYNFGFDNNYDTDFSTIGSPDIDFEAYQGSGMLGMRHAELIQQKINVQQISTDLVNMVDKKLKLKYKIRIPNRFQPDSDTKLGFYLSKKELNYKSDNPCENDSSKYRKINNPLSGYEEFYIENNLLAKYPSGAWYQVVKEVDLPSNFTDYEWFGIDIRSFKPKSGTECGTDEYIYLDDVELVLECAQECSPIHSAHSIKITSGIIDNTNVFKIDNVDGITELSFEVFASNGALVYEDQISCPNGIDHMLYWNGKLQGGADVLDAFYSYRIIAANECYTSELKGNLVKIQDYLGSILSNFDQPCQNGINVTPEPCCLVDYFIDNEILYPPPFSQYLIQENIYACTAVPDMSDEVRILNGANVLFRAGKQITLAEGFVVEPGADFLAEIKPFHCGGLNNNNKAGGIGGSQNLYKRSDEQNLEVDKAEQMSQQARLRIFPNPSNGKFTIMLSDMEGPKVVQLFNMLGTEVYNKGISGQQMLIDASKLENGIYTVAITTEYKTIKKQIVITK